MESASTQRGRGRGAPSRSSHSPLWIPPVANAPSVFLDGGGAHFHMGMPTLAYGMGGPPGGGASSYERPAWYELRALNVSTSSPAAVTSLLLDPLEELIWAGLDNVRPLQTCSSSQKRTVSLHLDFKVFNPITVSSHFPFHLGSFGIIFGRQYGAIQCSAGTKITNKAAAGRPHGRCVSLLRHHTASLPGRRA